MDTTVILAQPRVPRLRADVVYVAYVGLRSGSAGQGGALLCRQSNGQFGPPKIVYLSRILMQKNPRKIRWVGGSGVHPVYAYYFHPQHGEGYNPLWYDPQLGGTPPYSQAGLCCDFSSKCVPEPPSEPGYPRDSTRVILSSDRPQS